MSDKTILDISHTSGFSNVNSFNRLFKDTYNCSPTEYRERYETMAQCEKVITKNNRLNSSSTYLDVDRTLALEKLFNYLEPIEGITDHHYSNKDSIEYITVDGRGKGEHFKHHWQNLITFGRAYEGLRGNWQKQLMELQKEIGFKYIRFHGIFNDEMMVYNISPEGKVEYNWTYNQIPSGGTNNPTWDALTIVSQAVDQANEIKDNGYYLISTFIEDPNSFKSQFGNYYETFYKGVVAPYVKEELKGMASGDEYYIEFNSPNSFGAQVSERLKKLISVLNSNKLEIDIEEGYEVTEAKLYKGTEFKKDLKLVPGKNLIIIEDYGEHTVKYTIKEKGYYKEYKTPVKVQGIYFDNVYGDKKFLAQNPSVPPNSNETCELKPTDPIKKVNGSEHVDLEELQEEVTYMVETKVPMYKHVKLSYNIGN